MNEESPYFNGGSVKNTFSVMMGGLIVSGRTAMILVVLIRTDSEHTPAR